MKNKDKAIRIDINDDYPIKRVLTNFESYMFVTTEKHIKKHDNFECTAVVINGKDEDFLCISMVDIDKRKEALKQFNKWLANETDNKHLAGSKVSVCLLDLITELSSNSHEINSVANEIINDFLKWCYDNKRIGAIVEHFYQGLRYPHLHLIYERDGKKKNEFQRWLFNKRDV